MATPQETQLAEVRALIRELKRLSAQLEIAAERAIESLSTPAERGDDDRPET